MDIFDQYLFEELTTQYSTFGLTADDYEELYQRFCNIDYINETKPYIYAMRSMGWGTKDDLDSVLTELKELMDTEDYNLKGLYYDLKLFEDECNSSAAVALIQMIEEGYTDNYLKEKSHVHTVTIEEAQTSSHDGHMQKINELDNVIKEYREQLDQDKQEFTENVPEVIQYKSMLFESCGYSGLRFTSGDIDYLCARIYIEPLKSIRELKVRSQIFDDDSAFSDIMTNEYVLQPGTTDFKTTGWGNKNFYAFNAGIYKWVVELDGNKVYSQEFRIYDGKISKSGIQLKDVRLFASKASGALESDKNNYSLTFNSDLLEFIYFKLFIKEPGENIVVQIFIKVICLENNSIFCDKYVLHKLHSDTYACWSGVGYAKRGKWEKGLYKYCVHIGNELGQEGTFTIY